MAVKWCVIVHISIVSYVNMECTVTEIIRMIFTRRKNNEF